MLKKLEETNIQKVALDELLVSQTTHLSPETLALIRKNPRETVVYDKQGEYLCSQPHYLK